MPSILIRTEVGQEHGLGHAVRMRALAHALTTRGASVRFLTTTAALEAVVAPMACDAIAPSTHEDIYECISRSGPDVLICDTKALFDESLYPALRKGMRVVRIDHPNASLESCDLLVAPGNHWLPATVERLRTRFGTRFLYGWDYVMLPTEVTAHWAIPYDQRRHGPIVFCAGGSDPDNALATIAEWSGPMAKEPEWLFLVPSHKPTSLPGRRCPWATVRPFHREYLRTAALVIGFLGQTVYEALWYETPMLVFARSMDDVAHARILQDASEHRCCAAGNLEDWTQEGFCALVRDIYHASVRGTARARIPALAAQGIEGIATQIMAREARK